jgi:hypothetical protein
MTDVQVLEQVLESPGRQVTPVLHPESRSPESRSPTPPTHTFAQVAPAGLGARFQKRERLLRRTPERSGGVGCQPARIRYLFSFIRLSSSVIGSGT